MIINNLLPLLPEILPLSKEILLQVLLKVLYRQPQLIREVADVILCVRWLSTPFLEQFVDEISRYPLRCCWVFLSLHLFKIFKADLNVLFYIVGIIFHLQKQLLHFLSLL